MKIKIIKILVSFLLSITPMIYSAQNAHAFWDNIMLVDKSIIDLSPKSLTNPEYLNSTYMKVYLLECIKNFDCLPPMVINNMEKKLGFVEFFCLKDSIYNDNNQVILRIWIPFNIKKLVSSQKSQKSEKGILCWVRMDYEPRSKSCDI